jgi:CubicO group peptidase (beta-lactamase class C family)
VRSAFVAAAVSVLLAVPSSATSAPERRVDGWPTASAAEAGFRPARLAALAEDAHEQDSSCFAVVRDGKLVGDWNWDTPRTTAREVFSVTKSITSALVGIALRDGDLRLDDPVADYVPSWRGTDSSTVTVRNLLSNDSGRFWSMDTDYDELTHAADRTAFAVGLTQEFDPGTVWAYNNAAIQVLDRVLRRATGVPTHAFAATRLFGPLGMKHTRMTTNATGSSTNAYFGAQTTCLDLARFAQLYLHRGTVGGKRLLARSYVESSTARSSTDLNAAYGYLWGVNRPGLLRGPTDPVGEDGQPLDPQEGQLVRAAPRSLFSAIGLGGQIAMVDRRSATIVVRLGPGKLVDADSYGLRDAARVVTWASVR